LGTNQNDQQVTWIGDAADYQQGYYLAETLDWWWKGDAEIWYNDSNGQTQPPFFVTGIPVNQQFYDATWVYAPGVPTSVGPPDEARQTNAKVKMIAIRGLQKNQKLGLQLPKKA
jgi:hypothetical protein